MNRTVIMKPSLAIINQHQCNTHGKVAQLGGKTPRYLGFFGVTVAAPDRKTWKPRLRRSVASCLFGLYRPFCDNCFIDNLPYHNDYSHDLPSSSFIQLLIRNDHPKSAAHVIPLKRHLFNQRCTCRAEELVFLGESLTWVAIGCNWDGLLSRST